MTLDREKYERKFIRKVDAFSGKFMNDAKWTRLFKKFSTESGLIKKCLIKDIWDNVPREIKIPNSDDYFNTFHEQGIKDVMIGGPSKFKEIEQLIFVKNWKNQLCNFEQDIEKIKNIIDETGQFETEIDSEKLILYAYK